jgi:hypothetical protein
VQYLKYVRLVTESLCDRFVVMLDGRDKGVRIKPENLKPLPRETGNSAFTGLVKERT